MRNTVISVSIFTCTNAPQSLLCLKNQQLIIELNFIPIFSKIEQQFDAKVSPDEFELIELIVSSVRKFWVYLFLIYARTLLSVNLVKISDVND